MVDLFTVLSALSAIQLTDSMIDELGIGIFGTCFVVFGGLTCKCSPVNEKHGIMITTICSIMCTCDNVT